MKWLTVGALAFALIGCASSAEQPEMASAMVGIVNHTDRYIYSASVNGAGGANMTAYGAGGASVCCAVIPAVWYLGLKVRVFWDMPIGRMPAAKEKDVDVERYDEPGDIYIHLFPDDVVRVVVTQYGGASAKHPIPAPVPPANWKRS